MLPEQFSLQLPQFDSEMAAGGIAALEDRDGTGTADCSETPPVSQGSQPLLLDGESLTNVVKPIAYTLARKRGGGGEFDGALHITNFRLILQRLGASEHTFGADDPSLEWVSFPMGCIKAVTQETEDDSLAITITAKDIRSCRIRLLSNNALFVSTLTKIIGSMAAFSQSSSQKSFAIGHAAAVQRIRASRRAASSSPEAPTAAPLLKSNRIGAAGSRRTEEEGGAKSGAPTGAAPASTCCLDGWQIYDEEAEFVRQGVIKPKSLDSAAQETAAGAAEVVGARASPSCVAANGVADDPPRWRMFHNRSYRLVPTYPLYFIVPAVMGDSDVRAVAAYRSKGRLPAVTWMDPTTKAVLARSAQPLAGLGSKSCAEDARLLGLFGDKGKNTPGEAPLLPAAGDSTAVAPAVGQRHQSRASVSLPPMQRGGRRSSTGGDVSLLRSQEGGRTVKGRESISGGSKQGEGRAGRARRGGGGRGGEGHGESFLEAFNISSWSATMPWLTSKVALQQPASDTLANSQSALGQGPAEFQPLDSGKRHPGNRIGQQQRQQQREKLQEKLQEAEEEHGGHGSHRDSDRAAAAPGRKAPRLCVLDARTAVAALGNQLVGKGVETGAGYGDSTQLVFSGIGNVHAVKEAFEEMRDSLDPVVKTSSAMDRFRDDSSKMVAKHMALSLGFARMMDLKYALADQLDGDQLEEPAPFTLWPRLLRQILGASVLAARLLRQKGCSVLVHCSDGWDRTPQICSTVQLLLDPYYRTLQGFCVLIEKEWLSFGHKFWARCMGGSHENTRDDEAAAASQEVDRGGPAQAKSSMTSMKVKDFAGGQVREYDELSPVFLQFLELVFNVAAQFPTAFEFSEGLLSFVAEHALSGLYGTFLCDTARRRTRLKMKQRTLSVWTIVLNNRGAFVNPGYRETLAPLWPSLAPTKVHLWERQHCRVPSSRPHRRSSGSEAETNLADLWEDNVSFTCRLEHGQFHLGVEQSTGRGGEAETQHEGGGGEASS